MRRIALRPQHPPGRRRARPNRRLSLRRPLRDGPGLCHLRARLASARPLSPVTRACMARARAVRPRPLLYVLLSQRQRGARARTERRPMDERGTIRASRDRCRGVEANERAPGHILSHDSEQGLPTLLFCAMAYAAANLAAFAVVVAAQRQCQSVDVSAFRASAAPTRGIGGLDHRPALAASGCRRWQASSPSSRSSAPRSTPQAWLAVAQSPTPSSRSIPTFAWRRQRSWIHQRRCRACQPVLRSPRLHSSPKC